MQQLAIRSPVEEIKRLGHNLSRAENHALAFFFASRYQRHVQNTELGVTMAIRAAKLAAAVVFQQPASEWKERLTEHGLRCTRPAGVACACRCGCKAVSAQRGICLGCGSWCCFHCHPTMEHRNDSEALGPYFEQLRYDHPVGRCHVCVGRRKLTAVALEPPKPHDGLQWYFHAPFELSFELTIRFKIRFAGATPIATQASTLVSSTC